MGSQEILKQYNTVKNQYDSVDYDAILKSQMEKDAANKKADIDAYSVGMDSQIANTQSYYNKQIDDKKSEYESQYERNAVQKLINEKQIAEKNANLGLTDSGLNRAQQTAVQLSYANNKGNIDLARQSALDNLTLAMTNAITTLQNEKASGVRDIENNWKSYSENQAQNMYNTRLNSYASQLSSLGDQYIDAHNAEVNAAAEVQKAQISAGNVNPKLLYNWGGETVVDDNGYTMLKFIGNDGTSYNVSPGKNPYTNSLNAQISDVVDGKCIIDDEWAEENKDSSNLIKRACANYGVFSNGYQPKGIYVYEDDKFVGYKLKACYNEDGYIVKCMDTGKAQTVWELVDSKNKRTGKYVIWRGDLNCYEEVVI